MNIDATQAELDFIRSLSELDLMTFLSDIHDHGWIVARYSLSLAARSGGGAQHLRAAILANEQHNRLAVERSITDQCMRKAASAIIAALPRTT
jgi:hypothetical protein